MTWFDVRMFILFVLAFAPPIAIVMYFVWNWLCDYKAYKFQKKRPRILNPWSDW